MNESYAFSGYTPPPAPDMSDVVSAFRDLAQAVRTLSELNRLASLARAIMVSRCSSLSHMPALDAGFESLRDARLQARDAILAPIRAACPTV